MLSARKQSDLTLFAPELVHEQWTKTYYRSVSTINAERRRPPQEEARTPVRRIGTRKRVLKNANQKYRAAVLLSTRLATLISECGEEECSDRMDNLKSLDELWEAGKKTAIVEVVQEQRHIQAAAAILAEETSTPAIETVEDTANTHTEATEDVQQPDEDLQLLLEESKESQKTVIGLKRRRLATGPTPFSKLNTIDRNKKLLMCFVTASDADAALTVTLLTETSVEANPDNVDTLCLEENMDINSLRRYFDDDGWLCVQQIFRKKEDQPNWRCDECTEDLMLHDSICCDACLHWFHLPCLGMKTAPRVQKWFCQPCK